MTPSWLTERLHRAAVTLCLMLSGCQRRSQQHCLAAPRGVGSCVGLCSRLTLPLIRIDTGEGLGQAKSRPDGVQSQHAAITTQSVIFRALRAGQIGPACCRLSFTLSFSLYNIIYVISITPCLTAHLFLLNDHVV